MSSRHPMPGHGFAGPAAKPRHGAEDVPARAEGDSRQPWSVLVLLCVAQFMVILDMTVVSVALPSISRSLRFAPADLQWVVTAYLLATGGLTLLGGRAADLFGGRRMFGIGLGVFTAASLASGLAPDAAALVASRAAQGVGAALLTPAALAVITATYTGARRARALAVWGALAGGGLATGVLAGGALTTWFGWRSVFLVNVPVGLGAFAVARRLLWVRRLDAAGGHAGRSAVAAGSGPRGPSEPGVRGAGVRGLDLRGAVLAVGGLVSAVYAISGAPRHGWGSARTLLPLGLAVVLLAGFWLAERHASNPLLPPGTLRSRTLASGVVAIFATTGLLVGQQLLVSLFVQDVTGASAIRAGAEFLLPVAATALSAALASHLAEHAGTRVLAAAGLALLAAGALLLSYATADSGYLSGLLPGLMLMGLGSGLAFPAASITALSTVPDGAEGLSSGLVTTGHEVGAALGAAIFPSIAAGASFVTGYSHALTVAAVAGAALAVAAAALLPSVRPAAGTKVGFH